MNNFFMLHVDHGDFVTTTGGMYYTNDDRTLVKLRNQISRTKAGDIRYTHMDWVYCTNISRRIDTCF